MLPVLKTRTYLPDFLDHFFGNNLIPTIFDDRAENTLPAVNISENDKNFEIEMAVPGFGKENFKLELKNDILIISSKEETKNEEKNGNFMRKEFEYNSFCRSFSLPESVDSEKIEASYNEGVLKIELPKKEEAKAKLAREIKIS